MKYTDIIIRPLLSEKVSKLSEAKNKQYVFQVAKRSNKLQIKLAIEEKFEVKVKKVRTMNFKGKMKNTSVRSNGKGLIIWPYTVLGSRETESSVKGKSQINS